MAQSGGFLTVHNTTSSTLNLARMLRRGLDERSETTALSTGTLILLLDTLIQFAELPQHQTIDTSSRRSVADMLATFKTEGANGGL